MALNRRDTKKNLRTHVGVFVVDNVSEFREMFTRPKTMKKVDSALQAQRLSSWLEPLISSVNAAYEKSHHSFSALIKGSDDGDEDLMRRGGSDAKEICSRN